MGMNSRLSISSGFVFTKTDLKMCLLNNVIVVATQLENKSLRPTGPPQRVQLNNVTFLATAREFFNFLPTPLPFGNLWESIENWQHIWFSNSTNKIFSFFCFLFVFPLYNITGTMWTTTYFFSYFFFLIIYFFSYLSHNAWHYWID